MRADCAYSSVRLGIQRLGGLSPKEGATSQTTVLHQASQDGSQTHSSSESRRTRRRIHGEADDDTSRVREAVGRNRRRSDRRRRKLGPRSREQGFAGRGVEIKRIRSCCRGCGKMECGVWVTVQTARHQTEGDQSSSQSSGNHTARRARRRCRHVTTRSASTHPMKRTNPKGEEPGCAHQLGRGHGVHRQRLQRRHQKVWRAGMLWHVRHVAPVGHGPTRSTSGCSTAPAAAWRLHLQRPAPLDGKGWLSSVDCAVVCVA